MHWFVCSTFLLLLVFLSVHAGDDKGAASKKVDPDLDVETVSVKLPLYVRYCKKSYYEKWITIIVNPYVKCRVNVGGCKRYRCGKLPWDCKWCLPVYKYIKCSCPKPKKIKVVTGCECRRLKNGEKEPSSTTPAPGPAIMMG